MYPILTSVAPMGPKSSIWKPLNDYELLGNKKQQGFCLGFRNTAFKLMFTEFHCNVGYHICYSSTKYKQEINLSVCPRKALKRALERQKSSKNTYVNGINILLDCFL